jgi:CDP-diacylglycerol---serine O-phosphatidyltransferase
MSKDNILIKSIPNLFTSFNLLSGAIAIILSFEGRNNLSLAAYFIYIAAVFDFFDGFAARALNAMSKVGKELDSLADLVSFGIAPSMILYQLIKQDLQIKQFSFALKTGEILMLSSVLLIAVFSALRLAKFNVDDRQKENFLGLATPACAMFIASIPLIAEFLPGDLVLFSSLKGSVYFFIAVALFESFVVKPIFLIPLIFILSFLLVSKLPMFSMKFKSYSFEENKLKYIFIICAFLLFISFQIISVPLIFLLYITFSVFNYLFNKKTTKKEPLDSLLIEEQKAMNQDN